MSILTIGNDLAKNLFAVHGVDASGAVLLRQPKVARIRLNALVASLPPCAIGIEACSGAHHWAMQFQTHGHSVRLMAPKLVTAYRMSGKRGKNDAAICEAVARPNMRFVPVKSEDQQSRLMVRGAREGFVAARTGCIHPVMSLRDVMQQLAALLSHRIILPSGLRRQSSLSDCLAAMSSAQ